MSIESRTEERLTAVEAAIRDIQTRLAPPEADWLTKVIGLMEDMPEFDEVVALGRAFRESERLPEDAAP